MRLVYSHKTVPAEYCFLPHCALLSSKHNLWERLTPMNHTMCYAHPSPHTPCMLTPDVHLMKRFVSEDEWGRSWGGENIGEESPHSECVCTTATELPIHTSPPWVPGGWQAPQHLISFTMRPISGWHYSMRGGPQRPVTGLDGSGGMYLTGEWLGGAMTSRNIWLDQILHWNRCRA